MADPTLESIKTMIRTGQAPWQTPQRAGGRFMPYNPVNGTAYKALNALTLSAAATAHGFDDLRWVTRQQAEDAGARIRQGCEGTQIQYWRFDTTDASGQKIALERPQVMVATVYNGSEIDGLPEQGHVIRPMADRANDIRAIVEGSGATIAVAADQARLAYDRDSDTLMMPRIDPLDNLGRQHQNAARGLAAWTAHSSRLDRPATTPGSLEAAKEETRIEIATMFIGDRLQIGHAPRFNDEASRRWLELIDRDVTEIARAAAMAELISRDIIELGRSKHVELTQEQMQELARRTLQPNQDQDQGQAIKAEYIAGENTYLAVPYDQRHEAKKLGAQWDADAKAWFVQAGRDIVPFDQWRTKSVAGEHAAQQDPIIEYADKLRSAGFLIEGLPLMDGKLHRVSVVGDSRGEHSGSYTGHLDGIPAGFYQNFRDVAGKQTWKATGHAARLTSEQRAALIAQAAEHSKAKEQEIKAASDRASLQVRSVWIGAAPAEDHPYLTDKKIQPSGQRIGKRGQFMPVRDRQGGERKVNLEGRLLVPMWDENRELRSLQVIDAVKGETGKFRKQFWLHGQTQGTFRVIGDFKSDGPIHIVESDSTGSSVNAATGDTVVVAFTAYNLEAVAKTIRAMKPENAIFIAADNDHIKENELRADGKPKGNTGKVYGERAAAAIGAQTLLPSFSPADKGTDWNDVHVSRGLDETKRQLVTGMTVALARTKAAEIGEERKIEQVSRLRQFFQSRPKERAVEHEQTR